MKTFFTIENYNLYCKFNKLKNTEPDSLRQFRKFMELWLENR